MSEKCLLQQIGIVLIAVIAGKYFVNMWFQIERRNRYQQMQINLLIKLCKKQGVDGERLAEIIDEYNGVKK